MILDHLKRFRKTSGNSLMEFAVTIGLMAILAATAAPKLSQMGENTKIWNQVISWLRDLPQRTMIIVCTDSNGHVGSVRTRDPTSVHLDDLMELNFEQDDAEYPHIGPFHPEQENSNGREFRKFFGNCELNSSEHLVCRV